MFLLAIIGLVFILGFFAALGAAAYLLLTLQLLQAAGAIAAAIVCIVACAIISKVFEGEK